MKWVLCALVMGVSATRAAVVVSLNNGDDSQSSTTFTYSNLQTTPTFNGGALDAETTLTENSLSGASGSLTVTWTPISATNINNAATWTFGNVGAISTKDTGWGAMGGNLLLQTDEALLLTFNVNNLTLDPGQDLFFSLRGEDTDSWNVYERTGVNSGAIATTTPGETPAIYSVPVIVDGLLEFALTVNNNTSLGSFRIDVLPTSASVPDVLGLSRSAAGTAVTNAGLAVGTITESYSETVAANHVISQDPAGGGSAEYDSAVDLVISLGPAPALLQHLDATNTDSVATGGGGVTNWMDQTANGNDAASSAGSVLYPSTSLSAAGLAGLDMQAGLNSLELFSAAASDSWLDQSSGNGFCVLVAFKCDDLVSGTDNDLIGNSTSSASGFGMRYTQTGEIQAYLGGELMVSTGRSVEAGDTLVFAMNYDAVSGICEFWDSKNGTSVTGTLANADFSSTNPVTLGSAADPTRYINGMVGEVIVYGGDLLPAEFEMKRNQLMQKWIKRPNIVMIYVDDWAWNASSVAMDTRMPNSHMPDIIEMPNLDLMATNGMVFRNAFGSPQCSPARAALMTGQSNPRNGFTVYMNGDSSDYYDPKADQPGDPVL